MILVIDVGNTNIVLGVYQQEKLIHHWRLSTNRSSTVDEYGILIHNLFQMGKLDMSDIEGVIISCVVPPLIRTLENICQTYVGKVPFIVGPGIKTGLNIRYENPREVGADRIVNSVAAIDIYGGPLIVVDFGTATTFDYIDSRSNYLGGAIVPGLGISTEALFQRAAKLSRIELVKPKSVIGRNTAHSLQSGIIFGYAGQVDAIVERMKAETKEDAKVIATGGLAELIAGESRTIQEINPLLTLEGLRLVYKRNA